jgi:hypothetical protein
MLAKCSVLDRKKGKSVASFRSRIDEMQTDLIKASRLVNTA